MRERKLELSVSANVSALCWASKTRPPLPCSGWFRGVCVLVKRCMVGHMFPFSTPDCKSLSISVSFWYDMRFLICRVI